MEALWGEDGDWNGIGGGGGRVEGDWLRAKVWQLCPSWPTVEREEAAGLPAVSSPHSVPHPRCTMASGN